MYIRVSIIAFVVVLFTNILLAQNKNLYNTDFNTTLDNLDTAIEEFVNGKPENFINIWSHSEDITIAGGFGGPVERGWTAIEKRLSRVGDAYGKTEFKPERIYTKEDGNLGYLIQHEYFTVYNDDDSVKSTRAYRITMIFENENGEWKLVHRHADKSLEWKGMD